MDINKIIQDQAKFIVEAYANFEAMKKMAEGMEENSNAFDEYKLEDEDQEGALIKEPEDFNEVMEEKDDYTTYLAKGYQDSVDQWKLYMNMHAKGEWLEGAPEAFPPSLCMDEDDVDPEDPEYVTGKATGIPKSVWVHKKNAGRQVPFASEY